MTSLLETDLYKFSMGQAIFHQFPSFKTTWSFKCRNKDVKFTTEMVAEIKHQLSEYCKLRFTEDELEYLRNIGVKRNKNGNIGIIMLSARTQEMDKVSGLMMGADDYITKPFGMMALVARIKAVKRRYEAVKTAQPETELTAGDIVVSKEKHCVWVDGKQVFLTLKEFDMLVLLLENKGNVLTREQLLNSVWNYENDIESRTIDVHVRTLRQKLGASGELLETIRGVGYKIGE